MPQMPKPARPTLSCLVGTIFLFLMVYLMVYMQYSGLLTIAGFAQEWQKGRRAEGQRNVTLQLEYPYNISDTDDLPPVLTLQKLLVKSNGWVVPKTCLRSDGRRLDFVVSHFDENLEKLLEKLTMIMQVPYVAQQGAVCVWLITKGNVTYEMAETLMAPNGRFHLAYVRLVNRGREALNMLFYLAYHRHYTSFPSGHILFMQADICCQGDSTVLQFIAKLFTARTGMLGLQLFLVVDCRGATRLSEGRLSTVALIYTYLTNKLCHGRWAGFFNGGFIVSRRRVMLRSEKTYSELFTWAGAGTTHMAHDPVRFPHPTDGFVHQVGTELHASVFAHAMERVWNIVFNCTDTAVVDNCTCLAGIECPLHSCQCID
jgi:hypothetical protein